MDEWIKEEKKNSESSRGPCRRLQKHKGQIKQKAKVKHLYSHKKGSRSICTFPHIKETKSEEKTDLKWKSTERQALHSNVIMYIDWISDF